MSLMCLLMCCLEKTQPLLCILTDRKERAKRNKPFRPLAPRVKLPLSLRTHRLILFQSKSVTCAGGRGGGDELPAAAVNNAPFPCRLQCCPSLLPVRLSQSGLTIGCHFPSEIWGRSGEGQAGHAGMEKTPPGHAASSAQGSHGGEFSGTKDGHANAPGQREGPFFWLALAASAEEVASGNQLVCSQKRPSFQAQSAYP